MNNGPDKFIMRILISYRLRDIGIFKRMTLLLSQLNGHDIFYEFDLNFISGLELGEHHNIGKVILSENERKRTSEMYGLCSISDMKCSNMNLSILF